MNGIYEKLAALVCESINDDCVGFCNLTSPTNCFQCHCIAKHLVENGVTLDANDNLEVEDETTVYRCKCAD